MLDGERPVPLGGVKQRSLLALLLLARGRAVSTDRLIEELWNGDAPESARKGVHAYVSNLRDLLGPTRIETQGRGYTLRVERGEVDADRLEDTLRAAATEPPARVADRLGAALAAVRGPPLDDLRDQPWAETEAAHLDELVLTASEERLAAELELGHHARLVSELERLVDRNPYRERPLELLMLALYRSGRQADALATYRRGSTRLCDELGLEPSRRLRALEQRILNHEPSLEPPLPARLRRAAARRRLGWKLIAVGGAVVAAAAVGASALLRSGDSVRFDSLAPGVYLLDMNTHRVIARWPGRYFDYPWAFTGNGHFWVASFNQPGTEVDPRTGRFLHRFFPPEAADLALVRGHSVWFTTPGGLARYDLRVRNAGREVARYRIVRARHRFGLVGIAAGAGSIWVASHEENEVVRIDPATGAVEQRIPVRLPTWLAYGAGSLWAASDLDGIERIDPRTNTVAAIARVPTPTDNIAIGGGFAWVTNAAKGAAYKIAPSGDVVATYQTGDGAQQPSFSDGKLWVSNGDAGALASIDAATGAISTYRFGHPLGTEAAIGSRLVVAVSGGLTVGDQLAKLHGKVAKLIVPAYQFDPPDPPLTTNPFMLQLERATCAQLLRPSARTGALEPDLAAAMPTVSPDGRSYTFVVGRGRRFAPPSGAPVTAQAVKYSITRALSPQLGSPRPAAGYLSDVRRVRALGNSITFTLRAPSPDFLERLSLPYYCTVPIGTPIVQGGLQPIGPPSAAPYYMASRENGAWTVLKRNPYYRGADAAKLDAIVLREGLDPEKAVNALARGEWQGLALEDQAVQPGRAVARRYAHGPIAFFSRPEARLDYIALNARSGPLRNAELRRRVAAALDRGGLAAQAGDTVTADLLPPPLRGAALRAATDGLAVTSAHRLTLRMAVESDCWRCGQLANLVAAQLRRVDITVTPLPVVNVDAALRTRGRRIDLAALSTELPFPDPASFLAQMLGKDVPASWLPPTTRAALAFLAHLRDPARDRTASKLARRLARGDVPVIPYGTTRIGMLLRPELGCRRWDMFDHELDLTALCLRPS